MGIGWKRLRRPAVWQSRRGSPTGRLNEWWKQIFFWMNTPDGTLGPHTGQLSYMRCSCMQHHEGQIEAECMCCWGHWGSVREPNSEADQSALHLIGYHTSWKELRDMYHSVYLLNRAPGFPSCEEVKRRRAIQEILSSLQERLQRWTPSTDAKDAPGNEMDLAPPPMYEAALQVACQKVMETAASLQSDLDRLNNQLRGRPWAHSQSRSRHRTQSGSRHRTQSRGCCRMWCGSWHRARTRSLHWEHSQGGSEDQAGAQTQDHHQVDPQNGQAHSQDYIWEPLNRRVSFWMPEDEDSATESQEPSIELPIKDLELWLDHQADQLGTPTWWGELKAVPGMMDLCRIAWKIWASFHVPEIWSWASPNQGYSAPPAPRSLYREAFLPERLEYQDVRQRPLLLTEAYCQCLQHWVEKVYPPISLDACPLVENVRELCQAVSEFVTITKQDILEGLEMERPIDSHWLPPATLFSWMLGPPTEGWEKTPVAIGIPQQDGRLRLWGRACPFTHVAPTWPPVHLPGGSHNADISTHQSTGGRATFYPTPRFCWHHDPYENAGACMIRWEDLYWCVSCWENDTKDFQHKCQ